MLNLFLDPILLIPPSSEDSPEAWERYVERLQDWYKIRDASWVSMYSLSIYSMEGIPPDAYPSDQHKAPLGNINFQLQDILQLFYALLFKSKPIEDVISIREIIFDTPIHQPDNHLSNRSPALTNDYNRLVVLLALFAHLRGLSSDEQHLVTCCVQDGAKISLSVDNLICEFSTSSPTAIIPEQLCASFPAYTSAHALRLAIDPISLWTKVSARNDLLSIIQIFLYQSLPKYGLTDLDLDRKPWTIGPHFFATCRDLDFLHDRTKASVLLRACAETILNQALADTHVLRTGRGAGDRQRQRTRDKAGAWRRDIDYTYHLHYWQAPNGPELASVVHHDDMSIPE